MFKKQQFVLPKKDRQRVVSVYDYAKIFLNSGDDGEARFVDSLPLAHMGDHFMLLARDHFPTGDRPLYSTQGYIINCIFVSE